MSNLVIDIGTSAASFGVELAARYPERQIVVANEDLTDSELALPTKALLLRELEELPTRLQKKHGEHVYLLFPTKQNLENIISIDDKTWNALYRLCIPGALIDLIFGYGTQTTPILNESFIHKNMVPKLRIQGFQYINTYAYSPAQAWQYPSAWSSRLSFGKEEGYFFLRLRRGHS